MLVDWVRLNFGTTVTKSSTSHVGWYPPSTIPHGWCNMMLFWMVKPLWHPVFSDKAVDPRDILMGFATRCSQSAGTSASSSAPAALASAVGCLKVERKSGYSENLQTTAIFYRENDMENGDDPLELGIPCRQTRVCVVFLATP